MKRKILKFRKQEIADLTKEEQSGILGGVDETVGDYCTITCGEDDCDYNGITGACLSNYGGYECSPESDVFAATCYISLNDLCHTDRECTYADCTDTCPQTYGDATC